MEFDLLNELLESSVSTLFASSEQSTVSPNKMQRKQNPAKPSPFKEEVEEIEEVEVIFKKEEENSKPLAPNQWVKTEGIQRLQESMKKLKIENANGSNLQNLKLEQILQIKKNVKNELKSYDQAFKNNYNRLPNRQEKEPMRPLYMYYKKIKQDLQKKQSQAPLENIKAQQQSKDEVQQMISWLKQQKTELRIKLHNFQQEFLRTHNRKIRFHKDIQLVEAEYRRYKEIKFEISRLEQLQNHNVQTQIHKINYLTTLIIHIFSLTLIQVA